MLIVITGESVTRNLGKRRAKTFRWLASAAAKRNLNLYFVKPGNVVIKNGVPARITGYAIRGHAPFTLCSVSLIAKPVWIDLMYLQDLRTHATQYRRLRKAIRNGGHPMVNPVLPGKDVVYSILSRAELRPGRIPATQIVHRASDVQSFLQIHQVGWMKPVIGSGGRNMVRIEKLDDNQFRMHGDRLWNHRVVKVCTRRQLRRFIRRQLQTRRYLIQEEIKLPQLPDGHRIDFRVTVQRNEQGLWSVTATTLRRSGDGALVTNHHAGGTAKSWGSPTSKQWQQAANLTTDDRERVERAALQAARALQRVYPHLAYLGVDAAPYEASCYIYDCNSRPGRDILTNAELRVLLDRLVGFLASSYLPASSHTRS